MLIGIIYFIVRRFVFNDKALTYRDNIKLVDQVKQGGIRRDSLIVAFFILFHVGFRLLGKSFKVVAGRRRPVAALRHRAEPTLGRAGRDGALIVGEHLGWWLALGLILAFIPYFPYTKHFHLIMSGVNFLTKPKRTSLGTLRAHRLRGRVASRSSASPRSSNCPGRTWSTPTRASCATAARMSARPT